MRTPSIPVRRLGSLAAACLATFLGGSAWGQCPPERPEAILKCFAMACGDRDLDLYASLLAPDFVLRTGEAELSRAEELEMARRLFEHAPVRVEIEDGYRVVPGGEPGVWRIIDLEMRLTVEAAGGTREEVSGPWAFMEVVDTPGVGYRIRVLEAP